MNLLSILNKEINELGLTNKFKIAQYIYIRIGQLFEYDPLCFFSTSKEKEILKHRKVDINNVTDFDITCFSWAHMYAEILQIFGINAEVKYLEKPFYNKETMTIDRRTSHAYVELSIDNRIYIADLIVSLNDMLNIKLGLSTTYNCQYSKKCEVDPYEFSEVGKDIYQEKRDVKDTLEYVKNELMVLKNSLNTEMYIYKIFEVVEGLSKIIKVNSGYAVGMKYIDFLLQTFISKDYEPDKIYFYDKERQIYITVY